MIMEQSDLLEKQYILKKNTIITRIWNKKKVCFDSADYFLEQELK